MKTEKQVEKMLEAIDEKKPSTYSTANAKSTPKCITNLKINMVMLIGCWL